MPSHTTIGKGLLSPPSGNYPPATRACDAVVLSPASFPAKNIPPVPKPTEDVVHCITRTEKPRSLLHPLDLHQDGSTSPTDTLVPISQKP